MNFLISVRAETIKIKRTASPILSLLAGAAMPVVYLCTFIEEGVNNGESKDPWKSFFIMGLNVFQMMFLPMFVILSATLLSQIEYRNNTWKQLLASPQSFGAVFFAKFLVMQGLVLGTLLCFNGLMLLLAVIVQGIDANAKLFGPHARWGDYMVQNLRAYVGVLAMGAIQFWLANRFRNFIVPVAIGFTLWILGGVLLLEYHWVYGDRFPYSFPFINAFPKFTTSLSMTNWVSAGYSVVVLLLAYLDFSRRKEKG